MPSTKIRVLIIDDSLFMRRLISALLSDDPEIEVADTAKDGAEALKKLSKIKPDVITLDLVMPGWDGLTTLKHIMAQYPVPVVILSAYSQKDADITLECLEAGAVGFVLKPSGELSLDIKNIKQQLLEEVKAASQVGIKKLQSFMAKGPIKVGKRAGEGVSKIIVIGASTGGPRTIETIMSFLPENFFVPLIIVQHMPAAFFTQSLAEHLNKISSLEVKMAEHNEIIKPARAYLAPGRSQMILDRQISGRVPETAETHIRLRKEKKGLLSPSIDITMKSAAQIYGKNSLGIILTGMGNDGREGMRAVKEHGGRTIVQDESSLIFGMPKEVIKAGCADKVLPIKKIVQAMVEGG